MTSSTRKTQGAFCAMIFDCFARKTYQRSRRNIPTFPCNANRAKYRSERISVSTQGMYYKKISTSVTQSTMLLSRYCLATLGRCNLGVLEQTFYTTYYSFFFLSMDTTRQTCLPLATAMQLVGLPSNSSSSDSAIFCMTRFSVPLIEFKEVNGLSR